MNLRFLITRFKQIKLSMIQIEKQLKLLSKEKYEYLIGEDLGYKPGVVEKVKFEYYPLVEVFNKVLKKDDKSKFSEISSTDCKFDTLSKIYKDFKKLNISK